MSAPVQFKILAEHVDMGSVVLGEESHVLSSSSCTELPSFSYSSTSFSYTSSGT